MIQEEFWIARLAEVSGLQPESSELLWGAFYTQVEQRLLAGSSLYFPHLGAWSIEEHREFVAHTTDGALWLVPPRLTLRLQSEAERSSRSVSILLLSEILTQQTQVASTSVRRWLEALSTLTLSLLQEGASVSWPRLGVFTAHRSGSQGLTGYEFLPQQSFLQQLNKPFSMFAPVEVSTESLSPDLLVQEVPSLEALYPLEAQHISLLPAPELSPEDEEADATTPTPILYKESTPVLSEVSPAPAEAEPEVLTPEATLPEPEPLEPTPEAVVVAPEPPVAEPEEPVFPSPSLPAVEKEAPSSSDEGPHRYFWIGLILAVLLGIVGLYLLLNLSTGAERPARPLLPPADSLPTEQPAPRDTLPQTDSLAADSLDSLASLPVAPAPAAKPLPGDSPEQVRLHAGDRLSRLALKKYGHKAFWVYIYQENREKLSDPDNIPVGVVITLPAASKYHIDAQDTNSVNQALLLQRRLQRP